MKNKSLIVCAVVSALSLMNLNYSYVYAEKIKLKDIFKKKIEPKNDIKGSTSAKDSNKTPTLVKCKKKIATLAVVEPQDYEMLALSQFSLPSPTYI